MFSSLIFESESILTNCLVLHVQNKCENGNFSSYPNLFLCRYSILAFLFLGKSHPDSSKLILIIVYPVFYALFSILKIAKISEIEKDSFSILFAFCCVFSTFVTAKS